jgi:Domain of unknown function (DUF4598)
VLLSSTSRLAKSGCLSLSLILVLERVADFLPKLKESNMVLEQKIKDGENLDIEIFDEDEDGEGKQHIEMVQVIALTT